MGDPLILKLSGDDIMKNNIILIGMPGVGKSTIGVILAKVLGYQFLDSDLLIQKQEKRLLKDIIADEGVEGFIAIENQVNSGIQAERSIIATGGSAIYGREAMQHLKDIGIVVYLQLSYHPLAARLGNIRGRGVVLKEGQNLQDLYEERTPLYESYADIIINEEELSIESTLATLTRQLKEYGICSL